MTRQEALDKGYCGHCAAYGPTWRCGITQLGGVRNCILPAEVVNRWKGEFGLEGETQRFKATFGDRDLIKKRQGRQPKRHLK